MKRIISFLLVLATLTALSACAKKPDPVTDRLFEEETYTITLTSEYERQTSDGGILYVCDRNSVHVTAVSAKDAESLLPADCTLKEWAEVYRQENCPNATLEESDGLLSLCDMVDSEDSSAHRFRSFFYQKGDLILLLTFTADAVTFPSLEPVFLSYAKSFQMK